MVVYDPDYWGGTGPSERTMSDGSSYETSSEETPSKPWEPPRPIGLLESLVDGVGGGAMFGALTGIAPGAMMAFSLSLLNPAETDRAGTIMLQTGSGFAAVGALAGGYYAICHFIQDRKREQRSNELKP